MVHCRRGQSRTGLALATWMVAHHGLSAAQAAEEVMRGAEAAGVVRDQPCRRTLGHARLATCIVGVLHLGAARRGLAARGPRRRPATRGPRRRTAARFEGGAAAL